MVTIKTDDGCYEFPDRMILAAVRHAELQAELTAEALRFMGFEPNGKGSFPGAFMLELSALTTLKLWEIGGQKDHLPECVPDFEASRDALIERCQRGPAAFAEITDAPLSRQVFQIYIECFAWDGMEEVEASLVIGSVPDDQIVDCMAEFLWEHCHELQSILRRTKE